VPKGKFLKTIDFAGFLKVKTPPRDPFSINALRLRLLGRGGGTAALDTVTQKLLRILL
jgi:hypothetical protein